MQTIVRLASLLLPLTALLAAAPAVLAEENDPAAGAPFKPKEYELSRYSKNFEKKSPFEFDPPSAPVEDPVNHFEGVSLGSFCGSGNTMSVYLIMGKEKKRITVYGDGSPFKKLDKSGFRILSINRGRNLSTTTVLLEKNGQQKEIGFEKETLMAKGGAAGGQQPPVPGQDGVRTGRRLPIVQPGGGTGVPPAPYQPPPPFIPGQSNGQNGGGTVPAAPPTAALSGRAPADPFAVTLQPNVNFTPTPNGTAPPVPTKPRRVILPTQNP